MTSKSNSDGAKHGRVLVGPAGWSYSDWNGIVYPSRRPRGFHEAAYLAEFFDTIEINTSFYNPLRPELAAQWVERISGQSAISIHCQALAEVHARRGRHVPRTNNWSAWASTCLRSVERLGAVLLQFPFSFHNTPENLTRLKGIIGTLQRLPARG